MIADKTKDKIKKVVDENSAKIDQVVYDALRYYLEINDIQANNDVLLYAIEHWAKT